MFNILNSLIFSNFLSFHKSHIFHFLYVYIKILLHIINVKTDNKVEQITSLAPNRGSTSYFADKMLVVAPAGIAVRRTAIFNTLSDIGSIFTSRNTVA